MANRRMFSQRIVGDERFLEMPVSAQNLYFHLGIYADDDGFVNPQKVIRMIGSNPDDLKIIITKKFVIPFENGVVVVTNWKENNYIQSDRFTPTIYQEQFRKLSCIDNIYLLNSDKNLLEDKYEKSNWLKNRQSVMKESSLPFSFGYKIRNAFIGKKCFICGNIMQKTESSRQFIPTIQHNKLLIKGGKHELDNISIICLQCNLSWQEKEINKDNTEEVCRAWKAIVYGLDTQVRLGKDRIGNTLSQSDGVFSFKEEIQKMLKNENDKRMKIIAHYWTFKGWKFENKEQYQSSLKRELRPSKALAGYSSEQIENAMNFCNKEFKMWSLETVHKRITDLINK